DRTVVPGGAGASAPAAAPATFGEYRILRELGRGGMGVVYRALDPKLGREVALKVLLAGSDATATDIERFRREAAVLARLGSHPGLIPVHDIGHTDGKMWFTMEYVEGRSLRQRVLEEGPLPPREAAQVAADVAGALEHAHRAGVVHRDVKPHNILLGAGNRTVLGDFGLARDAAGAAAGLTASGEVFGTPQYMSPEQAAGRGRHATAATDVWSLGATLYETLTGHPPFAGSTLAEVAKAVIDQEPAPPSRLRTGLHADLETICLKAMRKSPAARYASAGEMEADLKRWLAGEPILARPVGAGERFLSAVRRRPAVSFAAAASLLVLAVVGLVLAVQARRGSEDARKRFEEAAERDRRAEVALREGVTAFEQGDAAWVAGEDQRAWPLIFRAEERLAAAASIAPENAEAHYQLGRVHRWRARVPQALAELEKAIALNQKHALAWFEHGDILQEQLWRRVLSSRRDMGNSSASVRGPERLGLERLEMTKLRELTPEESALRDRAVADFTRVLELGVAAEKAALGRAMMAHLALRFEDAIVEMDRCIALNPYAPVFHELRADLMEYAQMPPLEALPWRRRAAELAPGSVHFRLELAKGLASSGLYAEAVEKVRLPVERLRQNPVWLATAAYVCEACGEEASAIVYGEEWVRTARDREDRANAVWRLISVLTAFRRFDRALALIDENRALLEPDQVLGLAGEVREKEEKPHEALRLYRQMKRGSEVEVSWLQSAARCEYACGNTALAIEQFARKPAREFTSADWMEFGVAYLENDDPARALEFFERVRRELPGFNRTYPNLAGALVLLGRYTEAMEALETAFLSTDLPEAQLEAAKKLFANLKARAAAVKTPKEAGDVVASLAGLLTLASAQAPEGSAARLQAREGLWGIWRLLQQFWWQHGDAESSIDAGKRCLAVRRSGGVLYRDARARAASGKTKSALKALKESMELGFDEGKRLDGEKAFDVVRQDPEYLELRGRCR
ncbi:MAG: WD40 repeat-containing, partial [Planctomycetota bacterium]